MTQPILQFGTGRFLQAHVDLMVAQAAARGQALGGITVVQSTSSLESSARLAAMQRLDGFAVRIRGLRDGQVVDEQERVDCIREGLRAQDQWPAVSQAFVQAGVVVSNTADAGFTLDAADDASLLDGGRVPRSYPAKLVILLRDRWLANPDVPLTLLPTELVSRNGDVLRGLVAGLARAWGMRATFIDYVERHCTWANSLVDRIVSAPLQPVGAIAEPYALWAVERQPRLRLPCEHPAIQLCEDLVPRERLKLFVLNLAHTWLAGQWLSGRFPQVRTVLDAMHEPELRDALEDLWLDEVLPVFVALGMEDEARSYIDVVRDRLCNPFLAHALADIASNHEEKVKRRVRALLDLADATRVAPTQRRLRELAG